MRCYLVACRRRRGVDRSALDALARHDAAAATLPAFVRMPAAQRSVVIQFDVLDYSAQEISKIVDRTVPAVKSTSQRGRQLLRAMSVGLPGFFVRDPFGKLINILTHE